MLLNELSEYGKVHWLKFTVNLQNPERPYAYPIRDMVTGMDLSEVSKQTKFTNMSSLLQALQEQVDTYNRIRFDTESHKSLHQSLKDDKNFERFLIEFKLYQRTYKTIYFHVDTYQWDLQLNIYGW